MEGDASSGSAMAGLTPNALLHALIVALNETCDGKRWYTSTNELQVASLECCIACRKFPTLHLKVDSHIPRRLLAAVDAPSLHPKRLGQTRVPPLRARRVTWNMPTASELESPIFAMTGVDCLEFGPEFEGGVEAVAWPRRLKIIDFSDSFCFNKPIDRVQWPASLRELAFGENFNQPIEHVEFPASLQQLRFRGYSCFDQPIAGGVLPTSLQQLDLGEQFNQPVADVVWPTTLEQLRFGSVFNQSVDRTTFPSSLLQLTFGGEFNQPIDRVFWPDSLQRLVFGIDFNQPIDNVRWPSSLQELTFGLVIESGSDGILVKSCFNQRIDNSSWPLSLRRLTLGNEFKQSLQGLGTWMPNLEVLRLLGDYRDSDSENSSFLREIEWPTGLRQLVVFELSNLIEVAIPLTVQVLYTHEALTAF